MGLKCPRGIRTQLGGNSQLAQQVLGLHVTRDHQGVVNVSLTHALDQWIHMSGLAAIGQGQLVFRRCQSERADHHGGQGVGKFALEHRAFARDHAVILPDLTR